MRPGGGRTKGAQFEREVARLLHDHLGITFRRDIEQYRQAQLGDLTPVECERFPFVVECKRYASGNVRPEWWQQACVAAAAASRLPALVYRFDRQPIACVIPVAAIVSMADGTGEYPWSWNVTTTMETFCAIVRELM